MSNTTPQKTNTIQQRALKRCATGLHKTTNTIQQRAIKIRTTGLQKNQTQNNKKQ
jgi:hypothetical protein